MFWNAFLLAFREIRRNVLRSSLTILGLVIGVAAVIIMVTLGGGVTVQVAEQISSMGSNLLIVRPGQRRGHGGRAAEAKPLETDDATAISNEILSVSAVAPVSSRTMVAIHGNKNWVTRVNGSNNEYLQVRDWSLEKGRSFSTSELRTGKAVCLLGATVQKTFFGGQNPLGSAIRLKKVSCRVIGVLTSKGKNTMGGDRDDFVLMPLRTFQRRISGNQDINQIQLSAREGESTEKVKQMIELLMRKRRHISLAEDDDFSVMDMKEIASMLTGITGMLTTLLGAVAAVSLLVGGIGIMNIMLVSVTERTREIGIRMAIGALEREVLMQFLVEAVVLSSFGGLIGIAVALVASVALADLMGLPYIFNPGIVVLAFLVSAAVGIVFGFFPARRAAQLDPIKALQHE